MYARPMPKLASGIAFVALVLGAASLAGAEPKGKGYWCFTLAMMGSESSACARKEEHCRRSEGVQGASPCAWQATAWSSRIKVDGKTQTSLFATKEHCE